MKKAYGFTIVELLIVIVVIAILAAISVVAYNGLQGRASSAALVSDLRAAAAVLERDYARKGSFPGVAAQARDGSGLNSSKGVDLQYSYDPGSRAYCVTALSERADVPSYMISSDNKTPRLGACDGHSGRGEDGVIIWNATDERCFTFSASTGAITASTDSTPPGADYTCPGYRQPMIVPMQIGGVEVRSIDGMGYKGYSSVAIPNTVTVIKSNALRGMQFESLVIPDSVVTIEDNAVRSNSRLKHLVLSNNLKTIGSFAFAQIPFHDGAMIRFPSSVETIGDYAFYDFKGGVVLNDGLTAIGESAFHWSRMSELVIPSSVQTIGANAFYYAELKSLTLNEGTKRIEYGAFGKAELSGTLHIPDSMEYIGSFNFYDSVDLDVVSVPSGIEIAPNVFSRIRGSVVYR